MTLTHFTKRIAIIGGGPGGLFLYKKLLETGSAHFTIDIFEAKARLGEGMPYSREGASTEHITNVSGNEIPALPTPVVDWLKALPEEVLNEYQLQRENLHEYMTLPRLLFGDYLYAQYTTLKDKADRRGLITAIHLNCRVTDIKDLPERSKVLVETGAGTLQEYDQVIICTGHYWPKTYEGKVPGYYDSPYPPSKLKLIFNHPVAVRGSSLTAIDAIRTLARQHGIFVRKAPHNISFLVNQDAGDFKIVMHSRDGLLPAIRFHLDDSHLSSSALLTKEEIDAHIKENNGFLSLDFIFEKDFKEPIRQKDPVFYEHIKNQTPEEFVQKMMRTREESDPFIFFKTEYAEAEKSIRQKRSVYWKEMLGVLSFAMNYPAKHFSAEDMLRLRQVLMPLISVVIAYVPQGSSEELLALHDAGLLEMVPVGNDSEVETDPAGGIIYHVKDDSGQTTSTRYATFIDCIGQRHLMPEDFPFRTLINDGTVSAARLKFKSCEAAVAMLKEGSADIIHGAGDNFYLKVPGLAITDNFNVIEKTGLPNPRIHLMAVPFIAGHNPDYSGLDFCEEASKFIVEDILKHSADLAF